MPQEFIVEAVLRAVRRLPRYPHLSVMDLSCGSGQILSALRKDGCQVRGTHYREDDYILAGKPSHLEGIEVDGDVDLTRALPYADGSFDLVILTEVIEHLEGHNSLILEAGRILKPGGHLILTSPNLQRLHSRLQFALTGTHKLIRQRTGWDMKPSDLYAYHTRPVDFPLLHTLLHLGGLRIRRCAFTRFKLRHFWLGLFYPLIALCTWLEAGSESRNAAHRDGERDLRRWLLHPATLFSEQHLIVAQRA